MSVTVNGEIISSNATKTINVIRVPSDSIASIIVSDSKRAENSGWDLKATLYDNNGNPLKNKEINLVLNGNDYFATTDEYGVLKFSNKLSEGTYNITINNPATSKSLTKTITIVSRLSDNTDVVYDYSYSGIYKVKIFADNGEVAVGESVTFNINGVVSEVKTDSNGYATLKISNLLPKSYTVTAEYKGISVSNNVLVKQILKASNAKFKKSAAKKYSATLKTSSGKAIKNKKLTFKVNGKTYSAKSNAKGKATIKIKNLTKAGKYSITIKYLKTSIKKTITVR